MNLFGTLILTQLILFLFCAFVFRFRMPTIVQEIVKKNAIRFDGSHSKRRREIEIRAYKDSMKRIYIGLAALFFMTMITGVIVAGFNIPFPDLDAAGVERELNEPTEVPGVTVPAWQWPLSYVYFISTLFVAPAMLFHFYLTGSSITVRPLISGSWNTSNVSRNKRLSMSAGQIEEGRGGRRKHDRLVENLQAERQAVSQMLS